MADTRLRIAWFSDLSINRCESLSTYCTRLLVPKLAQRHTIEIFSDEATLVQGSEIFQAPVFHHLNAYKRHREKPFDLFFYQLEDSRACRFIRGHIGLLPGVVWVHDLFCNDLGPEACHTSPWEHTIKQFFNPTLGFSDRSKAPHQLWPRAFRETSLCPVVIFSSPWARNEFSRMVSSRLESSEGQHYAGVVPIPTESVISTLHEAAQPAPRPFQIATVSVPGIEGRSHKVLPLLRDLRADWRLRWLVDEHERSAVDALLGEFGIPHDRVTIVTGRSVAAWSELVAQCNVALHLHTSPFGHLAPFVQTSLAHGCPVVVARSAQGEDLPESVVFHITPGLHEAAELKGVLDELIAISSEQRRRVDFGAAGVAYARENLNVDRVVGVLSDTLEEAAPHVSYVMDRWQSIRVRAQGALIEEVRGLVSAGTGDVVSAFDRVIAPALHDIVSIP